MQEEVKFDINPFILDQGRVVLAKRHPDSLFGNHWHLPGGKVQLGETIVEALKRLAKTKTGFDIDLLGVNVESYFYALNLMEKCIGIYDNPERDNREHIVGMTFACGIVGGLNKPGKNITEVDLFTESQALKLDLAFDHRAQVIDGFDLYSHYME